MPVNHARHRVIALYKELHRLGRDYPDPSYDFHGKLRKMFESQCSEHYSETRREYLHQKPDYLCREENRDLTNAEDIEKALQFGEFIRNETLALVRLSKYRHLKRAYPSLAEPPPDRPPPT